MHTFLDEATIQVKAGSGGSGAMHFHREKYVAMGGPDGGDGGNGGAVYLRADKGLNTLFAFKRKRRFAAEDGQAGGQSRMKGRAGKDLVVDVPVGTVVRDADTEEVLGDLTAEGQTLLIARGGRGGLGNVHFKTSTNQAPSFAEKGEPGQERWLALELKLIADIGIIGCPNAGKSTLLSVLSAARPKIADYPFTTLTPNLGVIEVGDATLVAADIPGLIEGAHEGVGLGHEFLRHVERTLVLVHVVDGSVDDPLAAFEQVNAELVQYDSSLLAKPQIVAISKLDLPQTREHWPSLRRRLRERGYDAVAISAVTHEGLEDLIRRTVEVVEEQRATQREHDVDEPEIIEVRRSPDYFEIERKRHTFYVRGETAERLAIMTDMESDEAVYRLQRRLRQMGVFTALQRAGIQEGNKVRIGEVEFVWDSSYAPAVRASSGKPADTRRRR